jgi:hypothetical protein
LPVAVSRWFRQFSRGKPQANTSSAIYTPEQLKFKLSPLQVFQRHGIVILPAVVRADARPSDPAGSTGNRAATPLPSPSGSSLEQRLDT